MTTIITELDHDPHPLQQSVEEVDTNNLDVVWWMSFEEDRSTFVLPEDANSIEKGKHISPKAIANITYKRQYPAIAVYYTGMNPDFPLLVAAELIKKRKSLGGKILRPKYLADIIKIYLEGVGNRYRSTYYCPYYGVLAVSMSAALGHVDTAIDLANKYPKLLNKEKQPRSLGLFLQLVSKCSIEGAEQQLPLTEIHKNIRDQWVKLLLDYYPVMLASWEATPSFERE